MIWFLCWLLVIMAAIDGFFTARLKAQIHEPRFVATVSAPLDQEGNDSAVTSDIALVDAALNARYMQWGAVGVMMAMFVWNETKRQPARDKRFSEERKEDREAYLKSLETRDKRFSEERKEDREAYLKSLETRDTQYLSALDGIRASVEHHVQRFIEAKDKQTEAFHELAGEIRSR